MERNGDNTSCCGKGVTGEREGNSRGWKWRKNMARVEKSEREGKEGEECGTKDEHRRRRVKEEGGGKKERKEGRDKYEKSK